MNVRSLLKIAAAIFFWGIFILAVFKTPYPDLLTEASLPQLLSFFIPLFLAVTFTCNIFLKSIPLSSSLALGTMFMLILQGLNLLNLTTGLLVGVATILLISYFKKKNS